MRGDILYAWQVLEDGEWGIIASLVPGVSLGPAPLVFRDTTVAARVRPIAEAHGKATGLPVRLARFDLVEESR